MNKNCIAELQQLIVENDKIIGEIITNLAKLQNNVIDTKDKLQNIEEK